MQEDFEKIIDLTYKHSLGILTESEKEELEKWVNKEPGRKEFLSRFTNHVSMADSYRKRSLVNSQRASADMKRRLNLKRKINIPYIIGTGVAAAAILAFIWVIQPDTPTVETSHPYAGAVTKTLDIDSLVPGENLAYLINGEDKIPLNTDSPIRGVEVKKLKEKISKNLPLVLEVPRGGEFMVVLDDSTKVWLNSASTITYPETFTATDRRVKISGEAFFSVTKDIDHNPFYVECNGQTVQVYGTEFNVRSYPEDKAVYTSLASGSVAVKRSDNIGGELLLTPGTQSVFDKETKSATTKKVNIETVTGWRHGRFVFEDQTLLQIMNDLSRWYDFEFEFEDSHLEEMIFMGSIPRYADFSTAILILEKTGNITFKAEGNKILIRKK